MNIVNPYILTPPVDTSLKMEFTTTVANTTVYLPIRSSDSSGRLVFDDGTSDVIGNADQATHTFASAGVYVIKYYGTATSLAWGTASTAQKQFLTKILDWGITGATSASFRYCSSLLSVAANLESTTTDLQFCFAQQNGNPDVSSLNTSNVNNMYAMFAYTASADPDVSSWDTSSVTNMIGVFFSAASANPDVSSWDTSSVNNMGGVFQNATSANPDVSSWDTSNVTIINGIFRNATSANPDVRSWDTSSVTNMVSAFYIATSANPDMSLWNFSSTTDYTDLLDGSGISTTNYDGFLNRLNSQRITYSLTGRAIGDIPSTYTTSVSGAAR